VNKDVYNFIVLRSLRNL